MVSWKFTSLMACSPVPWPSSPQVLPTVFGCRQLKWRKEYDGWKVWSQSLNFSFWIKSTKIGLILKIRAQGGYWSYTKGLVRGFLMGGCWLGTGRIGCFCLYPDLIFKFVGIRIRFLDFYGSGSGFDPDGTQNCIKVSNYDLSDE